LAFKRFRKEEKHSIVPSFFILSPPLFSSACGAGEHLFFEAFPWFRIVPTITSVKKGVSQAFFDPWFLPVPKIREQPFDQADFSTTFPPPFFIVDPRRSYACFFFPPCWVSPFLFPKIRIGHLIGFRLTTFPKGWPP